LDWLLHVLLDDYIPEQQRLSGLKAYIAAAVSFARGGLR
jgi:hypothetical protein